MNSNSSNIKVLLVSLSNRGGGASGVVRDLEKELSTRSIDVSLLTYEGSPSDYCKHTLLNRGYNKGIRLIKELVKRLSPEEYALILFGTEDRNIDLGDVRSSVEHLNNEKIVNQYINLYTNLNESN